MISYLSYTAALIIGLVLGLTGGGGSILTVPALVYLMGINPVIASGYSLFIVGMTSSFGTLLNLRKGIVEIRTAMQYAIPSVISIFLTRKFVVPAIPETIFENQNIHITKEACLMVLFAVVMFAAALSMLNKKREGNDYQRYNPNPVWTAVKIFFVGILIGLIGAGGGFLIIPALIFMAKLPMKKAVGTSLMIIAINSLTGFAGDIGNYPVDWIFLFCFTAVAMAGIFTGLYFARFIPDRKLKKIFGFIVLIMAIFILSKELFFRL